MQAFPQQADTDSSASLLYRLRRPLLLLGSDLIAILGTALIIGCIRAMFYPEEIWMHMRFLPVLLLAPAFFYVEGLYDAVIPPTPLELRRLAIGTTLAFCCLGMVTFTLRTDFPSRLVVGLSWFGSILVVPFFRMLVRNRFASYNWWGIPVVLFGTPEAVAGLTRFLRFSPETGLRPVATVCTQTSGHNSFILATMPLLDSPRKVTEFIKKHPHTGALIMGDTLDPGAMREVMEETGHLFPSVFFVIGTMNHDVPLWLKPVEIAHTLTLQVRQNLFDPFRMAFKRAFDVTFASIILVILLPLLVGLAIWIRMDSKGPIFFTQSRIGLDGKPFQILKFRTMVQNAEELLAQYLEQQDIGREWEAEHKIHNDPRITSAGHFLRRTSLDELPQLFNVLLGDMSLVGPRPIVEEEIAKYGQSFAIYRRVRPGMTGLWQISGRNDTSYGWRVNLDTYYVCNWSLWMDLWILARTPLVVLHGNGAY